MKKKFLFENVRQALIFLASVTLLIGSVIGSLVANSLESSELMEISNYLHAYVDGENVTFDAAWLDIMLKYGKYLLVIWASGFFYYGIYVITLTLVFKGISYGFATALLVKQFTLKGVMFASFSFMFQNMLLIPLYIILSVIAIENILKFKRQRNNKLTYFRQNKRWKHNYILLLIFGIIITIIASGIEKFLVPIFYKFL